MQRPPIGVPVAASLAFMGQTAANDGQLGPMPPTNADIQEVEVLCPVFCPQTVRVGRTRVLDLSQSVREALLNRFRPN